MLVTYLQNKKIVLSLAVVAGAVFLIAIGVFIQNKILDGAEQKARLYQTAIQTNSDRELNYSIDTKQGRILTPVTIKQADTVKFPEMNKEFPYVKKTEERYTQHEREVCETKYRTETRTETYTDSDGDEHIREVEVEVPYDECHDETYYSWDFVQDWEVKAKEVDMAGRKYPIDRFSLASRDIDAKDIIDGQTGQYVRNEAQSLFNLDIHIFDSDDEGDIRYSYDVIQLPQSGTVFLDTTQGLQPVYGNKITLEGDSPANIIKNAQKSAQTESTIFNVFWGILVLGELIGGGYLVWFYEPDPMYL